MKRPICSRTWEAEAIGDDRLDATARASFERHAVGCEACTEELHMLARLRNATRDLPEYPSQSLDRRRLRMDLLQRANQRLMRGRGHRIGVWAAVGAATCALLLAVVGTRWGTIRHTPTAPLRAPRFEIVDVYHANWKTTATAGTVRVALSRGTAAIHVEHLAYDQRFLVELPDGDVEVRGTRFEVEVVGNRTMHLGVSEGVVALRLLNLPEIVLVAGQQWSAQESLATAPAMANSVVLPPASAQSVPSLPPSSPSLASRPVARAPAPSAAAQSSLPAVDTLAPAASVPVGERARVDEDGYGACIRAFQSGDYVGADRLLAAFGQDHPADARGEDAAFLRAVSHARMGDGDGAARLAHDYLQRYPQGLRRREAERLASSGGAPAAK